MDTITEITSGCALNIGDESNIKVFHEYYSEIPCISKDCIFFTENYEEKHEYPQGYNKYGNYSSNSFIFI